MISEKNSLEIPGMMLINRLQGVPSAPGDIADDIYDIVLFDLWNDFNTILENDFD